MTRGADATSATEVHHDGARSDDEDRPTASVKSAGLQKPFAVSVAS